MLAEATERLAQAVEKTVPGWVERCVRSRSADAPLGDAPEEAARWAAASIRDLGGRTPLEVLRIAVRYPTAVLKEAGVPPVERDDFSRERFPDDVYDLTPMSFGDVSPELADVGIVWGAARAMDHRRSHS